MFNSIQFGFFYKHEHGLQVTLYMYFPSNDANLFEKLFEIKLECDTDILKKINRIE